MTSYTIPGVPDASEAMLRALPTPQHPTRAPAEALVEAFQQQTDLVERLCDAVDRAAEDIGGESPLTVLRLLGPHHAVSKAELATYRQSLDATPETTPGARWREAGGADPHGNRYDCERAALDGGTMTDDEVANAVFLDPSIVNLTIAKDRIRWLSRKLAAATPAPSSDGAAGLVEALEKSAREAVALLDELNERALSRQFYGIGQVLHAKLATIRATIALAGLRHRAKPSVGVAIPDQRQILALRAIKAVTATTKNAVDGLGRIMSIARQAGVPEPYYELMADPDLALIVTADDRRKWQHLLAAPSPAVPAPEGEDEA